MPVVLTKPKAARSSAVKTFYGVDFPNTKDWPDIACHLWLFRFGNLLKGDPERRPKGWRENVWGGKEPERRGYEGEGRYQHLRFMTERLLKDDFQFHEWSERALQTFCEKKYSVVRGCSGSSKSTSAALYGHFFFRCAPLDTAVLCVSTSIDGARRRLWREASRFYAGLCKTVGPDGSRQLESPRPAIYAAEKDGAHIYGIVAVGKGTEQEAIRTLKGFHPKRILLILDEADSVPQDLVDVFDVNLQVGTTEAQLIALGNDPSPFNTLGRLCDVEHEPRDQDEWEPRPDTRVLTFNGFKSPNIRDGGIWKGIFDQKNLDDILSKHPAGSRYVDIFVRGRYNPDGADDVVIPESMFLKFKCRETGIIWRDEVEHCALLDPAFGGDRCAWRLMDVGFDVEGKRRVLFHPPVVIPITAETPDNPAEYQIAKKVMELNPRYEVLPANFILDRTGTGRGTHSVLLREYSTEVRGCEFGGAASERRVSEVNDKRCCDEYDRKVTELYFSFREFVEAGMVRGLDLETCREFSGRTFEMKGSGAGKRYSIETKQDFRDRGNLSPDLSDACVLGAELLRLKGIVPAFVGTLPARRQENWGRVVDRYDLESRGSGGYGELTS